MAVPALLNPIASNGYGIVWLADTNSGNGKVIINRIADNDAVSLISSIGDAQITALTVTAPGVPWFVASTMAEIPAPGAVGPSLIGFVDHHGNVHTFPLPAAVKFPSGIATADGKTFWITSLYPAMLTEFSGARVIKSFYLPQPHCDPESVAVDETGNAWVAEWAFSVIGVLSRDGKWREVNLPSTDTKPFEIAAGPDSIWFTEDGAKRIGRYSEGADKITEYNLPASAGEARGIAAADGEIWFTEPDSDTIGRLSGGKVTEYPVSRGSSPRGIAIARPGHVWFTEPQGGTFGITTFGAVGELSLLEGAD